MASTATAPSKTDPIGGILRDIPIENIQPSKTNPRRHFDEAALKELAESIKRQGIVQPILVRSLGRHDQNGDVLIANTKFEIVAGERRYRAAKIAGTKTIPCILRVLSDQDVLEIQVIENLQRMDLHPLEEADGYRQLMRLPKPHTYDAAKIAAHVGKSVKYIYDRIKLLELIEPLQAQFRENKITAGHAILLARLSPADQKRVGDRNSGGLWENEDAHFEEIVGKSDGYKLRSVRELQQYIDEHCRFVPERDADPMLFPETAALLKTADPKKKSDKVVALATGYVQDSARHGEKHISPASWERADGKQGSKTCDLSVIGVVIAGEDRAKAFRVCIAKDKCKVHWAERIRQRAKRNGMTGVKTEGMTDAERQRKEKEGREAEEKRQKEVERRWKVALPEILEKLAAAIKKAPAGPQSCTAEILKDLVDENTNYRHDAKKVEQLLPAGKTAEELVKHLAFYAVYEMADNNWDRETFIKHAKFFGVDVKKILDQAAPKNTNDTAGAAKLPATTTSSKRKKG